MGKLYAGFAVILFLFTGIFSTAQVPQFTRIDTGSLVQETIRGRGLYVVDYDMDGLLDLYIGNSTGVGGLNRPNLLFRNLGKGSFIKSHDPIISSKIYKHNSGSNWGDLDNDGDPDLYNDGELFLNDGSGSFYYGTSVTDRNEVNAIWVDLNNDGFLDILTNVYFEGNYAYVNLGNGTFKEIAAGDFSLKGVGGSQSFSMADADNDGDMDVFEANLCVFGACEPLIPNTLYINNNNGSFSALDSTSSLVNEALQSPGSSWGDYDNDGDMDLFVSVVPDGNMIHPDCSWFQNMLYLNRGDGTFYRVKSRDIINDGGEPHVMNDFDNDGDLDIIIGHGNGAHPYLVYVYLNNGNNNHWVNISCEGTISNRSAIGARIKVKAKVGDKWEWMTREISQENGVHACNGPRIHFGLGKAEQADSLIIRWPSGHTDIYTDIPADHFYKAVENKSFIKDSRTDL
ncbi:MAG: CRTAC1 family protein [Bacteroidota bacterium]|nr:CRTAC1 family protein [Bacteroidota bacterium]